MSGNHRVFTTARISSIPHTPRNEHMLPRLILRHNTMRPEHAPADLRSSLPAIGTHQPFYKADGVSDVRPKASQKPEAYDLAISTLHIINHLDGLVESHSLICGAARRAPCSDAVQIATSDALALSASFRCVPNTATANTYALRHDYPTNWLPHA
ncbi:hypothetical protein RRG08_035907 [Elysia crispata]|uniref:Uncharacterized protein n=1 Tax=Elysia crispata TaxID=231223 RepID=A0AAE1A1P3_9GAST|nr:hypothetical protein RRG08_035907 [Elysia crispata]